MKLSEYLLQNADKFGIDNDYCAGKFYDETSDTIYGFNNWVMTEEYRGLSQYEVNIDEDMDEYDSCVRRPYYRLRGKPVTEEQAFDIIRRTDDIFDFDIEVPYESDRLRTVYHIRNIWFNRNHFPSDMGWIHRDGTVGGNGITGKYPEFEELFEEMLGLLLAFPYLDFVLAITDWEEMPYEMWEHLGDDDKVWKRKRSIEDYDGFYEAIEIGFWVHDNRIEVLNPKNAAKKFKEYEQKYEVKTPGYYAAYYNMDNKIIPCDVDYLKRCIAAYGMDPEETLSKVREYIWNPKKQI